MTFVIPVHNRCEFTRQCLEALRQQTDAQFKTIVIDDGSIDGTAQMIAEQFREVKLLMGDGNLWWAEATNIGIRKALATSDGPIVCLNDDTVPPPEFVASLRRAMERNPGALISAAAVDFGTGAVVASGERVNWWLASHESLLGEQGDVVEVTHAQGRGLLIPSSTFKAIGLFDSRRFPQYAADYDFTHRARRAGFRIVCDRSVVLRIFPAASGDAQNLTEQSWTKYRQHLFGIRGGGNLKVFVRYAMRNCSLPVLPSCLVVGLARRVFGYLLYWLLQSLTPDKEGADHACNSRI